VRTGRTVSHALRSFSWRPFRREQAVRTGRTILQTLTKSVGSLSGEDRL
jgi:hypothetical protein